jgi:hypothetical protein
MRTLPDDTMPAIEAELVGGGAWRLAEEHPAKLALLVFYCGLHCPICRNWLRKLDRVVPRFVEHGVSVIALSCDTRERAAQAKRGWKLGELRVGYGIEPDDARKAGLYVSEDEGRLYTEPAILAVKPEDGTLYAAWVQSQPHARPRFADVLAAIESMIAQDLPRPRGGA